LFLQRPPPNYYPASSQGALKDPTASKQRAVQTPSCGVVFVDVHNELKQQK